MSSPNFKITFCWIPHRLVLRTPERWWFIGWVWLKKARLVKNINHGWIAFAEDQTEELLAVCPSCGNPLAERSKP